MVAQDWDTHSFLNQLLVTVVLYIENIDLNIENIVLYIQNIVLWVVVPSLVLILAYFLGSLQGGMKLELWTN